MVARGKGSGGIGEKLKGNKRYKLPIIKYISHRHVVYSTGNRVNNIMITLYSDRWLLDLLW